MSVRIADVAAAVHAAFPPETAESWDRVGLLAGDPGREVAGVSLALDPTREAIHAAAAQGANLLVTHHPAFLEPPAVIAPGPGAGGVLFDALDAGVALLNAHTNLDRAPGACLPLARALDLEIVEPLLDTRPAPMTLITVYAPESAAVGLVEAMAGVGAGRIGDYTDCSFTSQGSGSFVSGEASRPAIGEPGQVVRADEFRVEMVCPRARVGAALEAARAAHPYEEPLITAADVEIVRSVHTMGAIACSKADMTLEALAIRAAAAFGLTPRVWGRPDLATSRIALMTGSAGSMIAAARAAGADAMVAGEVRYHDALEAVSSGLAIVELGHDVTEWPLVDLLAAAVLATPGLDPSIVSLQPAHPGWWTPRKDR